ncbi:MAG: transcription termination/antitermination protein NusG [bacterium]
MTKQTLQEGRHWYAIHTYAGYENAVVRNLKQRIDSLNMNDVIFDVLVPVEKKIKIKNNKRIEEEEKIYPGYILVDMIVTDESWFVVRNTPRVTGFIGTGVYPVPLSEKEVGFFLKNMDLNKIAYAIDFVIGDNVKIIDGPFKDLEGKINEIDSEKGKAHIMILMFGRETSVELDLLQIKKI